MGQHPFSSFSLKDTVLPGNIFYSPLAGCSDYPFRKMSAKYCPSLMYCEMVKMDPLVRRDETTLRLLDYDDSMRPIGAQICGSKIHLAAEAAKMIQDLGFDVVDFNCGCPVDKVTKDGSGSGMLKNPDLIGEIISSMVAKVRIPVTVKIRAGWDESSIVVEEITKIAEEAGAAAIAIHGRTREQGYSGKANWDYIKRAVNTRKKLPVIGNGDVFSPEAAKAMLEETGCEAVLVSRGTMGNPWIAEDIRNHFHNEPIKKRTHNDRKNALLEHLDWALQYYPEKKAALEMRKVGCWYIKEIAGTREFRNTINKASTIEEMKKLVLEFPFGKEEYQG
jgi:tRNA-dihydrouridine synthase B